MITLLTVFTLIIATYLFVANYLNKQISLENESSGSKRKRTLPLFGLKPKIMLILGAVIFTINGLFFWADAGTAYAVQYPWGGDKMIKTQGLKIKFWGRTIPLSYEISIQDVILKEKEVDVPKETLPETKHGKGNLKKLLSVQNLKKNKLNLLLLLKPKLKLLNKIL